MKSIHFRAPVLLAALLLLPVGALRAATYTFDDTEPDGNDWSLANWLPSAPASGAGPGGTVTTNTDNAVIANSSSSPLTVVFDEYAVYNAPNNSSAYLNGLTLTNTGTGLLTFDMQKTLDIGALLGNTPVFAIGGAGSGPVRVIIDGNGAAGAPILVMAEPVSPVYTSGTVTLGANGTLELDPINSTTSQLGVNGYLIISGGTLDVDGTYANNSVVAPTIYGDPLEMSSGNIFINTAAGTSTAASTSSNMRFTLNGGIQATGGTIKSMVEGGNDQMYVGGSAAHNPISFLGTGVTFDTGIQTYLNGQGQSFYSGVPLGIVELTGSTYTKTLGAANANGSVNAAGTLNLGTIVLYQGGITIALASNVTETAGANQITDTYGNETTTLDVATHVYDMTQVSTAAGTSGDEGGLFIPEGSNVSGTNNFVLADTGDTTGTGKILAQGFDLSHSNVMGSTSVTGMLTLEAVGVTANNLGNVNYINSSSTNGGSISATSTFYYAPTNGGNSAIGTLTANRAIGGLHVGYSGANTASRLQLLSAITTQGNVQVDSAAILDVNAQTLTLSGSSVLTGAGTVTSGVAGGAVTWAAGATGGIRPGAAVGSTLPQQLTFTGTAGTPLAVTLLSTSVSSFNINSSSSFDSILLGANVTLTNGGTLSLDFTSGFMPTNGETFNLFAMSGGTDTGSFSSITSNIGGDTFSFNDTTGMLTADTAVPEPSSVSLILGALFVGGLYWRVRRSASARLLASY